MKVVLAFLQILSTPLSLLDRHPAPASDYCLARGESSGERKERGRKVKVDDEEVGRIFAPELKSFLANCVEDECSSRLLVPGHSRSLKHFQYQEASALSKASSKVAMNWSKLVSDYHWYSKPQELMVELQRNSTQAVEAQHNQGVTGIWPYLDNALKRKAKYEKMSKL
jgi:hypothetical protein